MAEMTLEQFAAWAEQKAADVKRLDYSAALREIVAGLTSSVAGCFEGSHDPDGRPWRPLELAFRPPLVGKRRAMVQRVIAAHRQARIERSSFTVEVDSDVAAMHNFGLKKRTKREFLGFGEDELDRAEATVADTAVEFLMK